MNKKTKQIFSPTKKVASNEQNKLTNRDRLIDTENKLTEGRWVGGLSEKGEGIKQK